MYIENISSTLFLLYGYLMKEHACEQTISEICPDLRHLKGNTPL